ncbi:MAG: hypothetical protein ACREM1_22285, partial [Longimicrobiales bacterium]
TEGGPADLGRRRGSVQRGGEPTRNSEPGTRYGIVTLGSPTAAVLEAVDWLAARGVALDFMRIRAFPFPARVEAFLREHELNFIVEQNRDGQLRSLILLETNIPKERLHSIRYYGGLPISRKHVADGVVTALAVPSSEFRVPGSHGVPGSEFRVPGSGSSTEADATPAGTERGTRQHGNEERMA